MHGKFFEFGYGDQPVKLSLPEDKIIYDIEGNEVPDIQDIENAVKAVLRNPIGTPPLREIVRSGDTVAILVSDITRSWIKSCEFLPIILDELNEGGVSDEKIFIMITLGAHRVCTEEEIVLLCGQEVCNRVSVYQHDCKDEENLVYMGTTSRGVKTYLNKKVVEADKVILTGGVVFHLMSGFSGGRKSVIPGISGYSTIQENHKLCLNKEVGKGVNPNTRGGNLVGNEMNEDMLEIASFLNPDFLFNAVFAPNGNFCSFFAGHWIEAWKDACEKVRSIYGISIKQKADLTIASAGGYPRDINLYQGAKTIQNAAAATRPGGVVICFMECRDIQEPPSYSAYFKYNIHELEMVLRDNFTIPGFICLKVQLVTKDVSLILVTKPENADFVRKAGMIPVTSAEEAMAVAREKLGSDDYTITVMTHAGSTVPLFV